MSQKYARKRRRRRHVGLWVMAVLAIIMTAAAGYIWARENIRQEKQDLPMAYVDEIRAAAGEFSLEPAHVAAVVFAESSYNPQAVSSVDARGLMQLLPSTAQWIAPKLDITYSDESLFDAGANLRYGCWYLRFLLDRYDQDLTCATAAYHAGQGTVDNWLADPAYSADGETLTAMAYPATQTYVERVLRYYEEYSRLYAALP